MITVAELREVLGHVEGSLLVSRNAVGNIAFLDPSTEAYKGYVDLRSGEVNVGDPDA